MTATAIAPERAAARLSENAFFLWMSLLCVAVAFGGFAAEYWAPAVTGRLPIPAIYHVHGVVASAWTLFLVLQAWLISSGRRVQHRAWGLAGISLATLMVVGAFLVAIASMRNSAAHGFASEGQTFAVVPITALPLFAGLIIAALVKARDRDTHKRLMLVATIGILEAALGRVFKILVVPADLRAMPLLDQPPPPLQAVIGPSVIVDLMIIGAMVYDWRTRGRPHPAYLIGGGALLLIQILRFVIGPSPAWHAFAQWLSALPG